MSFAEQLYLALVIAAFVSFGILLATLSWLDVRAEKSIQAAPKPASRQGSGDLRVSNA